MINQSKDCVSIAITDEVLKIVHVKGAGAERKIVNIAKKEIKDIPEDELGKVVQETLTGMEIKKADAVCIMPAGVTTTKNIEIPSVDPAEIQSIIDLQAGRHTPYSREEILIGYINIGVHSRNYTKVLLIIINRQIIKKYLTVFEQCGLRIEKVLFAPEGKARFYNKILDIKVDDPPVGIIDIGKHSTDFLVQAHHTVIACRNIPIGMENLLKEGEESMNKIVTELVQSLESYQNEDIDKLPDKYILTSDDAKLKELLPVLVEKLKANVRANPYLDHVAASQPVMLKIVSEYDDESFLDVIAPLNIFDQMQVDLTPEEIKDQRNIEEQGRQAVKAGVFGTMLLLLIVGLFFCKIYFRSHYLGRLTEEYEIKRSTVEELEQIATDTGIIKNYLKNRMVSLEVIHELYSRIPNEIYLKSVVLDEDGSIHINGVSETRSTAYSFITILENSELFKNAKMISSNDKKERGKNVSVFEMSFKLESAKDDEEEEEVEEEVLEEGTPTEG